MPKLTIAIIRLVTAARGGMVNHAIARLMCNFDETHRAAVRRVQIGGMPVGMTLSAFRGTYVFGFGLRIQVRSGSNWRHRMGNWRARLSIRGTSVSP